MEAWAIAILITVVLLIVLCIMMLWCVNTFCNTGASNEEQIFITECDKCNVSFSWTEKDTLVKTDYGATHTIACPHCGKLMKQHIK